jgi:predicted nucleic acid-binding protein
MNKVFLDINIVIDFIDSKRKRHLVVVELFKLLIEKEIEICISEDMFSTIFYIIKEKNKALKFFNYVLKNWSVLPFGEKVLTKAVELSLEKSLDLEDLLQCLCAKYNSCDCFLTSDKKFYNCDVKIYTINEFIKEYKEEE